MTRDGSHELSFRIVLYLDRIEHLQLLEILLSCRGIALHVKCLSDIIQYMNTLSYQCPYLVLTDVTIFS